MSATPDEPVLQIDDGFAEIVVAAELSEQEAVASILPTAVMPRKPMLSISTVRGLLLRRVFCCC